MKVFVLELKQDDPTKCTAAKLVKFKLIQSSRFIPNETIVLNPLSKIALSKTDNSIAKSICAIDCSWNYFDETIKKFKIQLLNLLERAGVVPKHYPQRNYGGPRGLALGPPEYNVNSNCLPLLRSLICAGVYPNISLKTSKKTY